MVGILALCIFSGSSVTYFLAAWIRSTSGFSSLAAIVGTVIGFFTGIYIAMGVLPEQVQNVTKFLPTTHGAAMMRQVYMEKAMDKVFVLAPPETEKAFQTLFGVVRTWGEKEISICWMAFLLIGSEIAFSVVSIFLMGRKSK